MSVVIGISEVENRFINEDVESPFGLRRIISVAIHADKSKLYLTLDNEKTYVYPDSFLNGFLKFVNVDCQKYIEVISEGIKKQIILQERNAKQIEERNAKQIEERKATDNYTRKVRLRQLKQIRLCKYYKSSVKGVAYLYDYYGMGMQCSQEKRNLSLCILGYKEFGQDSWIYDAIINRKNCYDKFTHDLFKLISKIVYNKFYRKMSVILISVPRSDKLKVNTMSKSIKQMVRWAEQGYFYNPSIKLIDGSNLLERKIPIEPEKNGCRRVSKHINSIEVKKVFRKDEAIILLDDITTTGVTMNACKSLLIQNGASEENIVCASLAQTVFDDEKFNQLSSSVEELLS